MWWHVDKSAIFNQWILNVRCDVNAFHKMGTKILTCSTHFLGIKLWIRQWIMHNNKLCYHTKSCKMPSKNNLQYSVELPSCAWARRRRIWYRRQFGIKDTDSIQTIHNQPFFQRCNRKKNVESRNKLGKTTPSVFILFFVLTSSHCLYHEENVNAHNKQDPNTISNYLSLPEGKSCLIKYKLRNILLRVLKVWLL